MCELHGVVGKKVAGFYGSLFDILNRGLVVACVLRETSYSDVGLEEDIVWIATNNSPTSILLICRGAVSNVSQPARRRICRHAKRGICESKDSITRRMSSYRIGVV
ncbi:MAG: hypothetical protein ACLRS8_18295 [Parabacteroides merdae]